jgi:hypothetical protein
MSYHVDAFKLCVIFKPFKFGHDYLLVIFHFGVFSMILDHIESGEVVID